MFPGAIPDSLYRGSRFSVGFDGLSEVSALWLIVRIGNRLLGFVPANCLVISNGVRNLGQGKAEFSLKGRNNKRRVGGLKDDQLCFLPILMSEEPEIFCVRLGYAVEGIW